MPSALPRRPLMRLLALALPLAAGVALAAWLMSRPDGPARAGPGEAAVPASVIPAPEIPYVPRAVGYGEARPARVWRAVPRVTGEIVAAHPELQSGALIREGAELYRIDPTGPELAIREAEAAIAAAEAALAELETRRDSTGRLLEIERERLAVARAELERQRTLKARGTVSEATVERQERDYLAQRLAVQQLENTLAALPAERRSTRLPAPSAWSWWSTSPTPAPARPSSRRWSGACMSRSASAPRRAGRPCWCRAPRCTRGGSTSPARTTGW